MMRLRNRFKGKKSKDHGEVALQITSLADVLMIVLIFLLKSISAGLTDSQSIQVSQHIKLPTVNAGGPGKDGVKVEISEDKVELGGAQAAFLQAFRFGSKDLNGDLAESSSSKSLNAAFAQYRKDHAEETAKSPTIWIVADRRAPYATIQTVIASAAMQGWQDFKLAVVKGD